MVNRNHAGEKAGFTAAVCNIALATFKLIAGLFTGALSLTADAVNNYSDAASSLISLLGFRLAERPADEEHPFGHARYEYIAAFSVSILIFIAGAELLKSSIEEILSPEAVEYAPVLFVSLTVSILVKLFMSFYQRRMGKQLNSPVLEAASEDSRNDAAADAAVLIGHLVCHLSGLDLDGYLGLAVSVFVFISGYGIVSGIITKLLGKAPDPDWVSSIQQDLLSDSSLIGAHDLMVHDYGPGHTFASVHIELPGNLVLSEAHSIADSLERKFKEKYGINLVVHMDPVAGRNDPLEKMKEYLESGLSALSSGISIHDMTRTRENGIKVLHFDCVLPDSSGVSEIEVQQKANELLHSQYPGCIAEIKFDRSFISMS